MFKWSRRIKQDEKYKLLQISVVTDVPMEHCPKKPEKESYKFQWNLFFAGGSGSQIKVSLEEQCVAARDAHHDTSKTPSGMVFKRMTGEFITQGTVAYIIEEQEKLHCEVVPTKK